MSSDFITPNGYTFTTPRASSTRIAPEIAATEETVFPTTPIYARPRKASGFGGVSPAALLAGGVVAIALVSTVVALSWPGPDTSARSGPVVAPTLPVSTAPAHETQGIEPMTDPTRAAPPSEAMSPMAPLTANSPANSTLAATPAPRTASAAAERPTRIARARPAPAPAAEQSGQDVSATLPAGPMPYTPSEGVSAAPSAPAPTPAPALSTPSATPQDTPIVPTEPAPANDAVIPGSETAPTP